MSYWAEDARVQRLRRTATTSNIPLGHVFGIEFGLNWSVLFVLALLSWTLARYELPTVVPGQPESDYWIAGILGAVAFVGCLVVHEVSHCLVALRLGLRVRGITLWFFGGVSEVVGLPRGPRVEAAVAAAGPVANLLIAAVALGLQVLTIRLHLPLVVPALLFWLAIYNAIISAFNLVPGFPLDGGLLLEAFVWWRTRDRLAGVRTASLLGRFFAYVMGFLAVMELFHGDVVTGVWIAFASWVQIVAVGSTEADISAQTLLGSIPVSDVMTSPVILVPGSLTVEEFLLATASRYHFSTYPLSNADGRLTGLVRLVDLIHVPVGERSRRTLQDCALPAAAVLSASPTDRITDLLDRLGSRPSQRALVFDQGRLAGVVSPADVARILTVRRAAAQSRREAA